MTNIYTFDISGVKIYLLSDYNYKDFCISDIQSTSIVCLLTSWYKSPSAISIVNENKQYHMIVLANSEEEAIYFRENVTCDVIICNKNIFLNEHTYTICSQPIQYDLVIDSCYANYKNRDIANKVENVIHIGYHKDGDIPKFGTNANYKNGQYHTLKSYELSKIYNQSYVGGIFSLEEGACLASTQYLLCGLPVVSTKSKGGRDFWYTKRNSIICENTKEDCYKCVKLAKQKIRNKEFNKNHIRTSTLERMYKYREIFLRFLIQKILDFYSIQVKFEDIHIDLNLFFS